AQRVAAHGEEGAHRAHREGQRGGADVHPVEAAPGGLAYPQGGERVAIGPGQLYAQRGLAGLEDLLARSKGEGPRQGEPYSALDVAEAPTEHRGRRFVGAEEAPLDLKEARAAAIDRGARLGALDRERDLAQLLRVTERLPA